MQWQYDDEGRWEAYSKFNDDGSPFVYRIRVCDDGTFSLSESDAELTDQAKSFFTLADAKSFCLGNEHDIEAEKATLATTTCKPCVSPTR